MYKLLLSRSRVCVCVCLCVSVALANSPDNVYVTILRIVRVLQQRVSFVICVDLIHRRAMSSVSNKAGLVGWGRVNRQIWYLPESRIARVSSLGFLNISDGPEIPARSILVNSSENGGNDEVC